MDVKTLALSFILFLVLSIKALIAYTTDEQIVFTVEDKERIVNNTSEGTSSKYLIFTDKGVFENTDTLFYWKWDSSDLYGQIQEGKTYTAKVYGLRVGFFSWYKNIIDVKQVVGS